MSMNTCHKCGDVYDTDFQMEEIDGEMVCDNCWDNYISDGKVVSWSIKVEYENGKIEELTDMPDYVSAAVDMWLD